MENKNNIYSRIYTVSKNIFLRKNSDSPNYTYNTESNYVVLLNFIQWLTGEYSSKETTKKDIIEGIVPIINFDYIADDKLEKFCEFYLDYVRNLEADSSVRKLKSNFFRISLLHNTQLVEQVLYMAENSCELDVTQQDVNVRTAMDKYYPILQQYVKNSIQNFAQNVLLFLASNNQSNTKSEMLSIVYEAILKSIDELYDIDDNINTFEDKFIADELMKVKKSFGICEDNYYTLLYLDLSCWLIMQTVINEIMYYSKSSEKIGFIQNINTIIENQIGKFERKSIVCSDNIFMSFAEFLLYPIFRSHFMENIEVLKLLQKECIDKENPQEKYSLFTNEGILKNLKDDERAYIYLEDYEKGKTVFSSNYEKCIEFIGLYNQVTRRNLKYDDITLKAVYRELILDKTGIDRRRSKKIFNSFIKDKKFANYFEYYFINEKINYGIFREYGMLEEFKEKNKLQENLYTLVSLLLTYLHPEEIFQEAEKNFDEIILKLELQLKDGEKNNNYSLYKIRSVIPPQQT